MRFAFSPILLMATWVGGCAQAPSDKDGSAAADVSLPPGGVLRIHLVMRHEQGGTLISESQFVLEVGAEAFWILGAEEKVQFVTEPTTCEFLFTLGAGYEKSGRTLIEHKMTVCVQQAVAFTLVDQEYGNRFAIRAWTGIGFPAVELKKFLEMREKEELEDLKRLKER